MSNLKQKHSRNQLKHGPKALKPHWKASLKRPRSTALGPGLQGQQAGHGQLLPHGLHGTHRGGAVGGGGQKLFEAPLRGLRGAVADRLEPVGQETGAIYELFNYHRYPCRSHREINYNCFKWGDMMGAMVFLLVSGVFGLLLMGFGRVSWP